MKRIFIPLTALIVGACTSTIDYDFSRVEPRLMAVGWLEQASDVQTVCISLSEGGLVKAVEDARVICTVNGKEVADVSARAADMSEKPYAGSLSLMLYSDPSYFRQLPVSFPASLRPGDKVRLRFEANQGAYQAATGELTVPEPVSIAKVDTARVTVRHIDWTDRYLQLRADVPDRKGEENWYSISLRNISEGWYSFLDGGPDLFVSVDNTLYIHDLDDPVLLDGNMGADDLTFFDFSGNGSFACFSDQMFRDGTAHLKMNAFSSWNDEGPDFMSLGAEVLRRYGYIETQERGFDRCRAAHRLEIRLSHCSRDAYFYLRALRTISSDGYEPAIVEPVTVPSNIEGGIGFVEVLNTAVARIDLPSGEEYYGNWRFPYL